MTLPDFLAEIELDLSWRVAEIRFHQNVISAVDESERNRLRRAALLMIYAHFEGYIKFCFQHYINIVNSLNAKCKDVTYPIAAASLHTVFTDLDRQNSKSGIFRDILPTETKLHRIGRQVEFLKRMNEIENVVVNIPDDLADTESNLKPLVLRKLLFELGLDYNKFDHLEINIHRLLNIRNDVGHGGSKFKNGVTLAEYDKLKDTSLQVMNEVKLLITNAAVNGEFIRAS